MPELRTILYVEDDPDIQVVAKMALEAIGGYSVMLCSSGADAVARASDHRPDLILLDVMMPGMDGPTTLSELRQLPELHDTPIVFMTAKVQVSEMEYYRSIGALDVIAKPFDPMALSARVLEIWNAR